MNKTVAMGLFLVLLLCVDTSAQTADSFDTEYSIVRVYGTGYSKHWKGVYKVTENLEVERIELNSERPESLMKAIMEQFLDHKKNGFVLESSTVSNWSGTELFEYVFRKERTGE